MADVLAIRSRSNLLHKGLCVGSVSIRRRTHQRIPTVDAALPPQPPRSPRTHILSPHRPQLMNYHPQNSKEPLLSTSQTRSQLFPSLLSIHPPAPHEVMLLTEIRDTTQNLLLSPLPVPICRAHSENRLGRRMTQTHKPMLLYLMVCLPLFLERKTLIRTG